MSAFRIERKPARYIGRCRYCKVRHSALMLAEVRVTGKQYAEGDIAAHILSNGIVYYPCCGYDVPLRQVVGKFSTEHKCGARCLASTGPSCECSCGGKNHGANFS